MTAPEEKRPVCVYCRQEVEPWNWALMPYKPPRKPIVTLVVCFPACKEQHDRG
jgi:hypothetical protein